MGTYNFILLLLTFTLTVSPSLAEVENVTYCDALLINGPEWAANHTLQLFDPSQGELRGVDLTVGLELVQNFSCENMGPAPQTVDLNTTVELLVETPNFGPVTVAATVLIEEELAGFDGEEDYSGPSGRTMEGLTNSSSVTLGYTDPSDFIATVPGETISLPASATYLGGGTPVPGNFISAATGSSRSIVCVTYTYEPKGSSEGGISG